MSLGIQSIYEEKKLEFMPNHIYWHHMIGEVVGFVRGRYVDNVVDISRKLGKELTKDEVRECMSGHNKGNRWAAFCINLYGKTQIKGNKIDLTGYRPKL